jgi:NADPH:quinone reductase-like Zn-dependent oxidoreductase
MNRLDSYTPLGYSLCGVVVEVGRGVEEFRVGQLVAAAGNEYALHAEYTWIPCQHVRSRPVGRLARARGLLDGPGDRRAGRAPG